MLSSPLTGRPQPWLAFSLNPDAVRAANARSLPVIFGDGASPDVLHAAGVETPRAFVLTHRSHPQLMSALREIRVAFPAVPCFALCVDVRRAAEARALDACAIVTRASSGVALGDAVLRGLMDTGARLATMPLEMCERGLAWSLDASISRPAVCMLAGEACLPCLLAWLCHTPAPPSCKVQASPPASAQPPRQRACKAARCARATGMLCRVQPRTAAMQRGPLRTSNNFTRARAAHVDLLYLERAMQLAVLDAVDDIARDTESTSRWGPRSNAGSFILDFRPMPVRARARARPRPSCRVPWQPGSLRPSLAGASTRSASATAPLPNLHARALPSARRGIVTTRARACRTAAPAATGAARRSRSGPAASGLRTCWRARFAARALAPARAISRVAALRRRHRRRPALPGAPGSPSSFRRSCQIPSRAA